MHSLFRRTALVMGSLSLLLAWPISASAQLLPGPPGPGIGDGPGLPLGGISCAVFMIRDVRLEGPTAIDLRVWEPVDLLDPNAPSELDLIDFPPGLYDRVAFTVEPKLGFMPGPTGRKVSTLVCGTINGVYFEYRDDTYDRIDLCDAPGVDAVPGQLSSLVAQFDVASWFLGIDFSLLETAADGVVYIDEGHHPWLQNEIRNRIKEAISLTRSSCQVSQPGPSPLPPALGGPA